MKKVLSASLLALALATAGHANAQTTPMPSPAASPGAAPSAPAAPVQMDPASDPKATGFIEGAALKPYEPVMKEIDTDKDGKISRAEFASAVKAGIIN
jgi:EF hand